MNDVVADRAVEALALSEASMETASLKTVRLSPDGPIESLAGTYLLDREGADKIIEAFKRHGTERVIDYDHASLGGKYAPPNGLAPAAGWVKDIFYEEGRGLFGLVQWNPEAADLIRANKYSYLLILA